MRKMQPGEVTLFSRPSNRSDSMVTTIAVTIGGKFTTKKVILVCPWDGTSTQAVMVTCVESSTIPKRPVGRPRKTELEGKCT
jgi:hypothetical protein